MRSFSLQPLSLALGTAFGIVCFFAMGQTTITPTPLGSIVRVEYMPHPRDMVQIEEGTPFAVPPGRIFVLTGLGATSTNASNAEFFVDGQPEASVRLTANNYAPEPHMLQMPPGLTVSAGSTITVAGYAQTGRAWGYLANE